MHIDNELIHDSFIRPQILSGLIPPAVTHGLCFNEARLDN